MIGRRTGLALGLASLVGVPVSAAQDDDIRALYLAFAAAQNARDLERVRGLLIDDPHFLWVSDGQSFWGRDIVLARMGRYQQLKIWHVVPDMASARAVTISSGVAYLHLTLALTIGQSGASAGVTSFLVSMLCRQTDQGWRIAALFTTIANPDRT